MSVVTGQNSSPNDVPSPNQGGLPPPESTMAPFNLISDPVEFAEKVMGAYQQYLMGTDNNDTSFSSYWQNDEIEKLATGWTDMSKEKKEKNQYLMTQLVKESAELELVVSAKAFEQSDKTVGLGLEITEGVINVGALTSSGFTTNDGVQLATQLKDGIGAVKTTGGVFEATVGSIMGIAWLPIMIGYEAVRAFKYHKKRRDGYKAAMDSHEGKKGEEDVKLFEIARYAYKKTSRAFQYSMAKIALKIVRMIALLITMLTGGTSAIVTASIAAIAAAVETMASLYRKTKGFFKKIFGKRGKNREKNAQDLVDLAKGGNVEAAQTIIDVDPFDRYFMKKARSITNSIGAKLFGKQMNPVTNSRQLMQGLEPPKAPEELIMLLQKRPDEGGWTVEHETMLVRALALTMMSQ